MDKNRLRLFIKLVIAEMLKAGELAIKSQGKVKNLGKKAEILHDDSQSSIENRQAKTEVDEIIRWLTGYNQKELEEQVKKQIDFETFFAEAPHLNPSRTLIKGLLCGVRVEDIEDKTLQSVRYLDKLIDELAQGKTMEKILRKS